MSFTHTSGGRTSPLWPRILLSVGFVSLTVALLAAFTNPAHQYEVSIYGATPIVFWIGAGAALAASLVVSFHRGTSPLVRGLGLLLGMFTFSAIAGLPLIRGYEFFGPADSLTHLGWIRDFQQETLSPLEVLYPATHTLAVLLAEGTGVKLSRAGAFVPVLYTGVYLLFLPLCVATLSDHDWALPFGLYTAVLLLPVNNVSVFLLLHPTSQAILFLPLILFTLFKYLRQTDASWLSPTPWGVALVLAAVSLIFVHPQQGVNVIVLFAAVAAAQLLSSFVGSDSGLRETIRTHHRVYVPLLTSLGVFLFWVPRHGRATGGTTVILEGVIAALTATAPSPVDGAQQRGTSLAALGGSVEELFVKLFLVTLVFFLLTGGLMLLSALGRVSWKDPDRRAVLRYLSFAFGGLFVVFFLYFLSSASTQHYRQLGTLAVLGSILGAVALVDATRGISTRFSSRSLAACVAPILTVLLILSLLSVYRAPYMFQASDQITDMEMTGYETAFDQRGGEVTFTKIRGGTGRYAQAVYGRDVSFSRNIPGREAEIPAPVFNEANMTTYYDTPHYLVVTSRDYEREVSVYNGFRFSQRGFRMLERRPGVSRVVSNGDFRMYYIEPDDKSAAAA